MNLETTLARSLGTHGAGGNDLAHHEPFGIGAVAVEPALRRISMPDGESVTLQPLAMRVLIALADAKGAICSRDDLVRDCWGQRIVGDDAVHRIISTLRRDLARASGGAVRIETIAKVGYRLMVADEGGVVEANRRPLLSSSRFSKVRPVLLGSAMLALAAAAVVAATFSPPADAGSFRIGVEPVLSNDGDREARRFASDVTSDLARFAGASGRIDLVDRSMTGNEPTDLLVRVAVERDGKALAARARLVDTSDGAVLVSREFRDEGGNLGRLRDRTAIGLAGVITCGLERTASAYDDRALRRLYFSACDALESENVARAEILIRRLVARQPDVAAGWACLAQMTLQREPQSSPGARATLASARRYAERAVRLDPSSGRAYAALASSFDDTDPRALEMVEKGLRVDPEYLSLYAIYAMRLFNAGYVKASVAPARHALALNPASRFYYGLSVRRLLAAGRTDEAFAVQEKAERLFPESPEIIEHRRRLMPYRQNPASALAEIQRSKADQTNALSTFQAIELRWRADPRSLDLAELDRMALAEFAESPSIAWYITALMTRLGQNERALAWLSRAPRRDAHEQWSLLFWPEVAPLRRDPQFFEAMAELGLVDLWVKRGKWPDFCNEPALGYRCRSEAERLRRAPVA